MTPVRTLGRTGAQVSAIGFGVSGPHASPAVSRSATIRLIHQAIDLGVTVFDTGPAYGNGDAESRLGAALKGQVRDRLFITSKAGIPGKVGGRVLRDFSPDGIARSLGASLARLDLDQIDALLLHGPHADELTPALFDRLAGLKSDGKFRHLGLCARGADVELAMTVPGFDILMAPCHAALGEQALARLQQAHRAGIGVMAIEAMASARGKWRLPKSTSDAWYLARTLKQTLAGQSAPSSAMTDPAAAMHWVLEQDFVGTVMSLTTRSTHLSENAARAGLDPARPRS